MMRPAAAAIFAACVFAAAAHAEAPYRTEHTDWGNDRSGNDRIYARDAISGKFLVLSREWGSRCHSRAALNYGLGGGCWYPVRESYPAWRKAARGWLRLRP